MVVFSHILFKNWWVIVLILMACGLFFQSMHKKNHLIIQLQEKAKKLNLSILLAQQEREELMLKMQSQNDPEWLTLVLKDKLGVVPEKQIKVIFEPN